MFKTHIDGNAFKMIKNTLYKKYITSNSCENYFKCLVSKSPWGVCWDRAPEEREEGNMMMIDGGVRGEL